MAKPGPSTNVHCGECGGPNSSSDRACSFCRAPIATLRCGHCYQLNVPEQDFCSGCGEVLGLVPLASASDAKCPRCQGPCSSLDGDPGLLLECPACAGQFVEHAVLSALLERRRRLARTQAPAARALLTESKIEYLRCPNCQQHMHRRNFGRSSGIIVDVCTAHGIWFDAGELPRVLSFVERGGLALARRMELGLQPPQSVEDERKQAALIAERLKQRPVAAPATANGSAFDVVIGALDGGLTLLGALVTWIVE